MSVKSVYCPNCKKYVFVMNNSMVCSLCNKVISVQPTMPEFFKEFFNNDKGK
ncbi:MAG: hypothetical protein ACOC1K_03145 [Nanoarchaeota archaeon]